MDFVQRKTVFRQCGLLVATALFLAAGPCMASGADASDAGAAIQVLNPNNEEKSQRVPVDIPDPATPWLLGIGLVTLSLLRRKARS